MDSERSAIYLDAKDAHALAHYGHIIPAAKGLTRRAVTENYPGWEWNEIVPVLRRAGLLVSTGGHGGQLREGLAGVLLVPGADPAGDDGTLTHPAKVAHRPFVPPAS